MQKTVKSEMEVLNFRERHIEEAHSAIEEYGKLSREWYQQHLALADDELNNGGLPRRLNQFIEDCRRCGYNAKVPTHVDENVLAKLRRKAVGRSQFFTQKMTGGALVLAVAVAIKTYLLWPLSTSLLVPILGPGPSLTKSAIGVVLALALSYAITFIARVQILLLLAIAPGEKFANHRNPGQLFNKRVTLGLLIGSFVIFATALWAFAQVDLNTFSQRSEMVSPVYAVTGLSMLFIGIIVCFELFWSYKTLRLQDEPDAEKDHYLGQSHLAAVDRLNDEKAVAVIRTLALDAQGTVYSFMEALDRVAPDHKNAPRQRGDAMKMLRRTLTPTRRAHPDRLWW